MAVIVQKYGGSSLATAEHIKHVAGRVAGVVERGAQVVVVVSAMGDTTDHLIELSRQISPTPDARELDLLLSTGETVSVTLMAMALRERGYQAISLTGAQAGIQTTSAFSRAHILGVNPERVMRELEQGKIVIVAGFQGISENLDITTLGRGGSDTTAVALAAALKVERCEIYTDVEGVFTADPRVVPEARRLNEIDYHEMLELASLGARVMHNRAVELAAVYGIPVLVASSFVDKSGTLIHGDIPMEVREVRNKVSGIAHDRDVAKITVVGVPDRPGIAAALFEPLAQTGLSVDTIVQNAGLDNYADLTFTVSKGDLAKAMALVEPITKDIGARGCVSAAGLAKVSIVGTGIQNAPGYAARMFRTLSDAGINIEMITTSEIRITCVISEDKVEDAVRALHRAFELEKGEE